MPAHRIISHRGNLRGPNPEYENRPDYILHALSCDDIFGCEIDIWYDKGWYLGHDRPQYSVPLSFLKLPNLWLHAKSVITMSNLMNHAPFANYFFHEFDHISVTSQGFIWTTDFTLELGSRGVLMTSDAIHGSAIKSANTRFDYICTDYCVQ